jgi:MFS family permease
MYPVYEALYSLSVPTISVLTSLQYAFSIVVSPLVGNKSDSTGKFTFFLAFGLILFAVGTAGYAVAGLFLQGFSLALLLVPFTILVGVGGSFYHPLGATVLSEKWKTSDLGRAMGINGSAGAIGRVVLPFSATLMITSLALPSVAILAAVSLVGALASFVILRSVKFESPRSLNGASAGLRNSLAPDWKLMRRLSPLTMVSFSRGLFSGVLPLVPLYLVKVDNFSRLQAGLVFSLALSAGIVSQLIFGYLEDHLGNRLALGLSNAGGVIVLFGFVFSRNPILTETMLLLFGLFSYSAFPLLLGLVHQLVPANEMTSAGSIVWGIGNTSGGAVAPLLIGALALPWLFGSLVSGFLAAAILGIVSIVLMPFI